MSGTATANPFGGDPGKKFDVLFSVDMKEFMTGLGAKPEEIARVLATAERNAKKAPAQVPNFSSPAAPGGMPGGPGGPGAIAGMPGGMPGAPGGMPGAPGGAQPGDQSGGPERAGRKKGGGSGSGISEDQRTALFTRMTDQLPPAAKKDIDKMMGGKKLQDLSAEQRDKIFTKLREASQGGGGEAKGGGRKGGKKGDAPEGITVGGFTEADRERAKLPLPPEEDSQLEVLLRPGLLADVEIIVEKIPDAIHIPNQAVFERDGRQFVYVQNAKDNHFDERMIKLAKRSESVMVIADGLKPGETIALGDPTAKKNDKNEKSSGSSKPGVGMPSAGAAPGGKGK
jgi:hypothetical protein